MVLIEVVSIQLINAKDCFLHLSPQDYDKLNSNLVKGIKLTKSDGRVLYFSLYPGGNSSLSPGSVGISPQYAFNLNLLPKEKVVITGLQSVGLVTRIQAAPLTDDDSEILHSSAGVVESALLDQLKVVWPKQVFVVWVSPSVSISLVVETLEPDLEFGKLERSSEVEVMDPLSSKAPPSKRSDAGPPPESLLLRTVPLSPSTHPIIHLHQPFRVYVDSSRVPESLRESPSYWTIQTYPTKTPNSTSEVIETMLSSSSCFVVELQTIKDESLGEDFAVLPNLYVSWSLACDLGLEKGVRVKLETAPKPSCQLYGLLVSPCSNQEETNEAVEEELRSLIIERTIKDGSLVLNTKTHFNLSSSRSVVVVLRPLSLNWTVINLASFRPFPITATSIQTDTHSCLKPLPSNPEGVILPSIAGVLVKVVDCLIGSVRLRTDSGVDKLTDNLLILGPHGSGKSTFLSMVSSRLGGFPYHLYVHHIDCKRLKAKRVESVTKTLSEALSQCVARQPSALMLEDLQVLCGVPKVHHENSEASFHLSRVSQKLLDLVTACQASNQLALLATADSVQNINSRIWTTRGKSLFSRKINLPELIEEDRLVLLRHLVESKLGPGAWVDDSEAESAVKASQSYTVRDVVRLTEKAIFEAWQDKNMVGKRPSHIRTNHWDKALRAHVPSALQNLSLKECPLRLCDVGGLDSVKARMVEVVIWPSMYPLVMNQCPLKQQNAVLLYGAPGSGKTLLANAIAGESGLNLITVKGPELLSKYIGESEEGVRNIFEKARAAKPCLLFFDEFESLAPRRGNEQTGVSDRVVNQLLTALDGVEGQGGSVTGLWVVAASSRPDLVDPALLRPGRIGLSLHCPLPDREDRLAILRVLAAKAALAPDVDLPALATLTDGFSGADLKGLLASAQLKLLDKLVDIADLENGLSSSTSLPTAQEVQVTQQHLLEALADTQPSLSAKERLKYEIIYKEFSGKQPLDLSKPKQTLA